MIKRNQFSKGFGFGAGMSWLIFFFGSTFKNIQSPGEIFLFTGISIIAGMISGFIYKRMWNIFLKSKSFNESTKVIMNKNEQLIFETYAVHFKNLFGAGGKLYLTDQRLIFKSHKFNLHRFDLNIPLSEIIKAYRYKMFGMDSSRISFLTTRQKTEKFVVDKRDELLSMIGNLKSNFKETPLFALWR